MKSMFGKPKASNISMGTVKDIAGDSFDGDPCYVIDFDPTDKDALKGEFSRAYVTDNTAYANKISEGQRVMFEFSIVSSEKQEPWVAVEAIRGFVRPSI